MSTAEQREQLRRLVEYTRDNTNDKVDRGAALRQLELLDEVDRLTAERDAARTECNNYVRRTVEMQAERDALAAELAQVRAEAAQVDQTQDEPIIYEPLMHKAAPPKRHPWDEA